MKKALIKQKLIGTGLFLFFLLGLVIAAALEEDCTFFLFALPLSARVALSRKLLYK